MFKFMQENENQCTYNIHVCMMCVCIILCKVKHMLPQALHNYKREDTILFTKIFSSTVVHCQYTTVHVTETIASENKVHNCMMPN